MENSNCISLNKNISMKLKSPVIEDIKLSTILTTVGIT